MKKLTAVLCTAAMILGLSSSVFAAGSITQVVETQTITDQIDSAKMEEIKAAVPGADKVVVRQPDLEKVSDFTANESVQKILDVVNGENKDKVPAKDLTTMMLENANDPNLPDDQKLKFKKSEDGKEILTESDNPIDPTEYEPICEFSELGLEDAEGNVIYDEEGKIKEVKAPVDVTNLIGEDDAAEDFVIMLTDAEGNVYFIEIDEFVIEKDADGNITSVTVNATFPCFGVFTIMQKSDSMTAAAETEMETAE